MKGWQKMRDITDASSLKSRSSSSIRRHPVDNELDTFGNRPADHGDHRGWSGPAVREGSWSGFNRWYGRIGNLTSKVHDWSLGFNYDVNGKFIGRGPVLNSAHTLVSYAFMPPSFIYTAVAFSSTSYQHIFYQE